MADVGFKARSFQNLECNDCTEFKASKISLSTFWCYLYLIADIILGFCIYWFATHWEYLLLLIIPFCVVLYLSFHVKEEKITIINGIGIELKLYYSIGAVKTKFIGDSSINAILIHESIHGSGVRYALAFIIQGDKKLTLCFSHVYPGIRNLTIVYKEAIRGKDLVEPVE